MNRFKIVLGKENEFENVWKSRDTHLEGVKGFKNFNLIKGDTNENFSLYSSHSTWDSKEDFINCRREIRKGTGEYTSEVLQDGIYPRNKLPHEERWSARHFSLDKIFTGSPSG